MNPTRQQIARCGNRVKNASLSYSSFVPQPSETARSLQAVMLVIHNRVALASFTKCFSTLDSVYRRRASRCWGAVKRKTYV